MVGTQRTCRAYPIRAEAIECEKARVGGRIEEMDIGRVIELDELELPELGEHDLRLKILAVSAEPDIPHATPRPRPRSTSIMRSTASRTCLARFPDFAAVDRAEFPSAASRPTCVPPYVDSAELGPASRHQKANWVRKAKMSSPSASRLISSGEAPVSRMWVQSIMNRTTGLTYQLSAVVIACSLPPLTEPELEALPSVRFT